MKERPIFFIAPMVRALLDGSKTQTRRILKPQPVQEKSERYLWHSGGSAMMCSEEELRRCLPFYSKPGKPGDRLWVRETWRIGAWSEDDGEIAVDYMADDHSRREWLQIPEADDFEKYWLQCCDDCDKVGVKTDEEGMYHWEPGQSPCRIRPSIFMPRWASRITLEITGVRVERLQDISDKDCLAEGIADLNIPLRPNLSMHRSCYADLWETINGPGSWDANPWVWVIEFKRLLP